MKNLLYIHGLKMSKDSAIVSNGIAAEKEGIEVSEYDHSTLDLTNIKKGASGTNIKEMFAELGYATIAPGFDLFDVQGTLDIIKELIKTKKITLIVASSLGGFYSLALEAATPVIALNPTLKPTEDVTRLNSGIPSATLAEWQKLESGFSSLKPIYKRAKFAVFAKSDELFHHKETFDSAFSSQNSVLVEGPHQLSHYRTFLDPGVEQIIAKMKSAKVL